jgi:hypothetical protein
VVGQKGLLYIGDSKMDALITLAHLVAGEDYYLTPLSLKGEQAAMLAKLIQPVLDKEQDVPTGHDMVEVYREPAANQEPKRVFSGYESSQHQEMQLARSGCNGRNGSWWSIRRVGPSAPKKSSWH